MSARDVVLRGRAITRRWGGVVAVNGVSIELVRGEVHAVIGTNGAGKSTLINVLSGEIAASSGAVELLGALHVQFPRHHEALPVIEVDADEIEAKARVARDRPGGIAREHVHFP